MKNFISIALSMLLCSSAIAQKTVKEIIYSELETMLIDGDILNTPERNKELKEKGGNFNKRLLRNDENLRKSTLDKYFYPIDGSTKKVIENFKFPGINMAYLGSYLIKQDSDFKTGFPYTPNLPELPVLVSSNQLGITNPNRNNYNLFSDLTYLMSLDGTMEGASETPYFDTKAKTAIFKSNSNHQTLSVAYGNYNNQLAQIFSKTTMGGGVDPSDMEPLLQLWLLYNSKLITGTEKILNSFNGLAIYRTKKIEMLSKTDVSNQTNIGISSIPFFKLEGKSDVKWARDSKSTISENSYDIYMVDQPSFERVPSADKIKVIWDKIRAKEIEYPKGGNKLLLSTDPSHNIITLKFGPAGSFYNNIALNSSNVLTQLGTEPIFNSIELGEIRPSEDPGFYNVQVKLNRNETYFQTLTTSSPQILKSLDVKLSLFDPINTKELSTLYKVTVEAETLPFIAITDVDPNYTTPNYEVNIKTNISSNSAITSAKISHITLNDKSLQSVENVLNNSDYFGTNLSGNSFAFRISQPIDPQLIAATTSLGATVTYKIMIGGTEFTRNAQIELPYKRPNSIATTVVDSYSSLWDVLPKDIVLENKAKLMEYLDSNKAKKNINIEAFNLLPDDVKKEIKVDRKGNFEFTEIQLNKLKTNQ